MKKIFSKQYISVLLVVILCCVFIVHSNSQEKKQEVAEIEILKGTDAEENNSSTNSEVNIIVIDGVTYRGYKGPVQGEVKYKEGTPADTNSYDYKASGDIESPYHVDLTVTMDYGNKTMFSKNVGLVKDEVGMEVMFRNLDIQTAYGGGFVNSINGIESKFTFYTGKDRKKLDWFYWVNGILAPVGVGEYRPQAGDEIWWDYHDWGMTMFVPAVIGSYPHPFINGAFGKNPGTVIMYTNDFKEKAIDLKQSLNNIGVKQVDIALFDPEVVKEPEKYYILLGTWDDLAKDCDAIQDINKKNKLVGVYAKFEAGNVHGLDFKGRVVSTHKEAGAIFTYGSSIGSINPVWMVTGTNEEGVNMALDVLINNPNAIDKHFGAIVSKDGIENIPYID